MFERFEVIRNAEMRRYTTLKLGGPADWLAFPRSREEIAEMFDEARQAGIPVTVIGHGSNLLVADTGIRGLVIRVEKNMRAIRREGNFLTAEAGAMLAAAAAAAAEAGLSGLEFASGIPGTVGGAAVMNAGAYGGEMKDILLAADILEMDGTPDRTDAAGLELGYRHSNIPELGRTVLGASFRLLKGDPAEIEAKMKDLNARRKEKQPLEYPSAGSTFKRPEGYFAGKLIEDAGLKGFSSGGAQVSEKHAGFVINRGDATAKDILQLIQEVQRRVFEHSGVRLEPEIRMAGEF